MFETLKRLESSFNRGDRKSQVTAPNEHTIHSLSLWTGFLPEIIKGLHLILVNKPETE
jgi:hypothetical protein